VGYVFMSKKAKPALVLQKFRPQKGGTLLTKLGSVVCVIGLLLGGLLLLPAQNTDEPIQQKTAFGSYEKSTSHSSAKRGTPGDSGGKSNLETADPKSSSKPMQTAEATASDALAVGHTELQHREWFVGEWEQLHDFGLRRLEVRDDGTATIDVKVDSSWSFLVGDRLHFDIEWNIENGRLVFHTTGGKPEASIKYITKLYGTQRTYQIREFTQDRIVLTNKEGEIRPDWKRSELDEK